MLGSSATDFLIDLTDLTDVGIPVNSPLNFFSPPRRTLYSSEFYSPGIAIIRGVKPDLISKILSSHQTLRIGSKC